MTKADNARQETAASGGIAKTSDFITTEKQYQ